MSDDGGPGTGNVVAGIFLILFGLCLTLLGGGCTIMWVSSMTSAYGGGAGAFPLLLLSFVTLGAGIALIWLGVKLMTGGFNKP